MDQITNRIRQIIEINSLTPSQFADKISINRSRLSHILTGRNFASLDIVQSILASFPEINPQWLLTGEGELLREAPVSNSSKGTANKSAIPDLFSFTPEISENKASEVKLENRVESKIDPNAFQEEKVKSAVAESVIERIEPVKERIREERWDEKRHSIHETPVKAKIKMIAIYYDNNEYELLYPEGFK